LKVNSLSLLSFFAPWCGHCQKLAPEWEKAATNLKDIVPVGKVDCTVHQGLCGQYGVQGYPTIKIFSQKGKKVEDYQQARQAGAIVKYATDSIPNNVVRIKDGVSLDSFLGGNSDIPHLILFTSKSDVSPILKSLSTSYKGRVAFGQVKEDIAEVVSRYSIDSFPKILMINADQDPIAFDGAINPKELKEFVSSHASDAASSTPPPPPPTPKPKPKPQQPDVSYVQITEENIESVCTKFCVIGFVDTETEGDQKRVKAEHKTLLDDILNSFKKDGKFVFGWVDKNQEASLVKKFSLDSSQPALVVFNQKRSKFIRSPTYDFTTSFKVIEHVLTGDAKWETIAKEEL
jgi:protein disulfide-isomerase A6